VVTALAGGTLVSHVAALVILALTVSLNSYLLLCHRIGLPIFGLGAAALVWYCHFRSKTGKVR
jgi:hypothetical protein